MQNKCQGLSGNSKKYKGIFNWYKEIHELHTTANSEKDALGNMIAKLAGKLGYKLFKVREYFLNTPNSYKIEEIENVELSSIKTPSFPKTTVPVYVNENSDFICLVYGFNESKSQFYIEFPIICPDYVREYMPTGYKSTIGPMNPQKAKEMERKIENTIKEVLILIENGNLDEALRIIQFHKLKF